MLRTRVIPVLLLKGSGLVKGKKFKNHNYVGDPINAVKIFNEKEVDELLFFDISTTPNQTEPNYTLISSIASEAFMPFGYGGGITNVQQIEKLFALGVEKVVINTAAYHNPEFVREACLLAGSQSIVVSMDIKKTLFNKYEVFVSNGLKRTKLNPVDYAKRIQDLGAGELIVSSIDGEGTGQGYDLRLLESVSSEVEIPVVALGGAGKLEDFADAVNISKVSAVAAGDMFVFHGKHKAVLITYPEYNALERLLKK